jgi:hypothetical protein
MPKWSTDHLLPCIGLITALCAASDAAAQVVQPSVPLTSTPTWTVPLSIPIEAAPAASGETRVYPDTSLTACPAGEKLKYFFYYQDIPDLRGPTWCGAAEASNDWANRTDPLRWRIPYLMESCQPGVAWYYSHALGNGQRYYSPAFRRISMVCEVDTCPVAPLTPLTDPVALEHEVGRYARRPDMDNLNDRARAGAACILQRAAGLGASAVPSSGFRPPAYQAHLREVWDKWQLLKNNDDESCRETKQQISAEWDRHELVRRPVTSSNHSTGNAVDIKRVPAHSADAIAAACSMFRPEPKTDPVHFQPR